MDRQRLQVPPPVEIHVGQPCRCDRWVRDVIDIPPQIEPRTWPQPETTETVPTAFLEKIPEISIQDASGNRSLEQDPEVSLSQN